MAGFGSLCPWTLHFRLSRQSIFEKKEVHELITSFLEWRRRSGTAHSHGSRELVRSKAQPSATKTKFEDLRD